MDSVETLNAVHITSQTLVGCDDSKFPVTRGNCFSVRTDDFKEYRIVNFYVENWDEMIRRGLELPVKIHPLSEWVAVIQDERIPDSWYSDHYCETCCPLQHRPLPQVLAHSRRVQRGDVKISGDYMMTTVYGMEGNPLFKIFNEPK